MTLFRLPTAAAEDRAVDAWFDVEDDLRRLVAPWFMAMRGCGPDVRVLIHDGAPTACVRDAAFAYVNAFRAHAAIGFFNGADLPDPAGLLEGAGRRMRHVKLRVGGDVNEAALAALIAASYDDVRTAVGGGSRAC